MKRLFLAGCVLFAAGGSPLANAEKKADARTGKAGAAAAKPAAVPAAQAAPVPSRLGLFGLGRSSFTLLHECQKAGWTFLARPGEKVVFRRGKRFGLTAARAVAPKGRRAGVRHYRLSFLNGRLAGLRIVYETAAAANFAKLRRRHGPPTWETRRRAEWVAPGRARTLLAWKDGSRLELVDLRLATRLGFLTGAEVGAELRKRRQAAAAQAPKPAKPGGAAKSSADAGPGKKDDEGE